MAIQTEGDYNAEFYDKLVTEGSLRSARIVVDKVRQIYQPQSVIDIGCGTGTWLKAWQDAGTATIQGVDGDYVDRERLLVDPACFMPHDLTQPLPLDKTYDLAMSVEVGEHLPAEAAAQYVATLTRLAPVVLFGAAIPDAGGHNHVNEQWLHYWQDLFAAHDYVPLDALRGPLWEEDQVEWWYIQDTLLYCHRDMLATMAEKVPPFTPAKLPTYVHPRLYQARTAEAQNGHRQIEEAYSHIAKYEAEVARLKEELAEAKQAFKALSDEVIALAQAGALPGA